VNCDLINNKNLTVVKLGMWTSNALLQLHITYCVVKACIAESNVSSKLKNHEIPGHMFIQTPFFVSMIRTHS
jgi:hypothetical protein